MNYFTANALDGLVVGVRSPWHHYQPVKDWYGHLGSFTCAR